MLGVNPSSFPNQQNGNQKNLSCLTLSLKFNEIIFHNVEINCNEKGPHELLFSNYLIWKYTVNTVNFGP